MQDTDGRTAEPDPQMTSPVQLIRDGRHFSMAVAGFMSAPAFAQEENPFPWMAEMIDLKKERNFFETRVIEYQTGGALSWE